MEQKYQIYLMRAEYLQWEFQMMDVHWQQDVGILIYEHMLECNDKSNRINQNREFENL